MDKRTDQEIIRLVLEGQTSAFSILVSRHQEMAYRTAFSITRNCEDAEEVTQDSFVKAFMVLDGFRGKSRFSTWLFRIVYHKALNHLESSKSYKKFMEFDDSLNADSHSAEDSFAFLVEKDREAYVGQALDQLNPEDRMALSLYYLETLSQHEISEMTGWSLASTKQRIHRARAKISLILDVLLKSEKKNLL